MNRRSFLKLAALAVPAAALAASSTLDSTAMFPDPEIGERYYTAVDWGASESYFVVTRIDRATGTVYVSSES